MVAFWAEKSERNHCQSLLNGTIMLSNRLSYPPSPGRTRLARYQDGSRAVFVYTYREIAPFRVLRCCMEMLRVLVIAWGAVGAVLLVLLGYRGTLTRYEEDQIFLNDAVSMESQQQTDIQRKLLKIRPFLVAMVWTIGALTTVILVMFVKDMVSHLL
jgi:hypothetical protein